MAQIPDEIFASMGSATDAVTATGAAASAAAAARRRSAAD
jgi:hypothetical protein